MSEVAQKSLVLILARDLASKLATPVFIVDAAGDLVFFNEAAEGVLGKTFAETHEIAAEQWSRAFEPVDEAGDSIPLEELPIGIALFQRVPVHRSLRIRGADGVQRDVAATAFPLYAHKDDFVGAVAVFWEHAGEG